MDDGGRWWSGIGIGIDIDIGDGFYLKVESLVHLVSK